MTDFPSPAPEADSFEDVAGLRVPDPYRRLEQATAAVREWQTAQAAAASAYVESWGQTAAVRALVRRYWAPFLPETPSAAGGRWFWTDWCEKSSTTRILFGAAPLRDGTVVTDLATLMPDRDHAVLSWIAPARDGEVLAVGVCGDGSERNAIRIVETTSGEHHAPRTHLLHDSWTGGVAWLPDSSGFYYFGVIGDPHDFRQAVFLHMLAPDESTREQIPLPVDSRDYTLVQISSDGRWATAAHGLMTPTPVALRDLTRQPADWRPFLSRTEGTVAGHVVGDRYIAVTDVHAPRGRVVAIPLAASDPDDQTEWEELVPPSETVLRTVRPVGDLLYLTEYLDTYARIRVCDERGRTLGHVALPGDGALSEPFFPMSALRQHGHADGFVFGFSTLKSGWGVYRHRRERAELEVVAAPEVELPDAIATLRWAVSRDGTRIPYHTLQRESAEAERPVPTLIYGYGGFNQLRPPQYPGAMAAFVAAGGLFVHVHLRGGAEFGREWWEAGRLRRKQNSFDDVYAVAEDLIARGVTAPSALGLTGISNGGLMAGVAVTQRPELWKVVVVQVPWLDLIGGLRDPYSRHWIGTEYADLRDGGDVQRLLGFSPYQLVREADYPAIWVVAGDNDPRCPPWHARKWTARMQAAQRADEPILLKVWNDVGHGGATPKEIEIEQAGDWLAYVMRHLGMEPREPDPERSLGGA